MTITDKALLKKATHILTDKGFRAFLIPDEIMVELCSKDVDNVLAAYSENGISMVDDKISEYGRKLEATVMASLLNSKSDLMFQFTGYKVDSENRKIYVTLSPTKASSDDIQFDSKLSKEKYGVSTMANEKQTRRIASPTAEKVKAYESAENAFRTALLRKYNADESIGIMHDILKDADKLTPEKQDELKSLKDKVATIKEGEYFDEKTEKKVHDYVDDTVKTLRDVPYDNAIETMNKVVVRDEKPSPEKPEPASEEIRSSIDKKVDAAKKEADKPVEEKSEVKESAKEETKEEIKKEADTVKEGEKGYDPATNVYTGKDEGPFPTFNSERKKPGKLTKKPTESWEKPKKPSLTSTPTLSQESYKKKSALALRICKMAEDLELFPKIEEEDEFNKLMEMPEEKLVQFEQALDTVNPESTFLEDGQLVDLNELFGE